MDKKTIGILGATGYVGKGAVNTLLSLDNHHLLLGSRNLEKLQRLFPGIEGRADCLSVDIYITEQLRDFCKKCDLVINCTGPSAQVLDTVANQCLEQGIHYMDVSGDESLYKKLIKKNEEIKEKGLLFIVAAGAYPGLSEVFPVYAAKKFFDVVDTLKIFLAGKGGFSENAAYDIVSSMETDSGAGMTYCKNGRTEKIDGRFHKSYIMPQPAGKLDTYPTIGQGFQQMAKKYQIKNAYFYNTYPNKELLTQFAMIKVLQQYKTEEEKKKSAEKLAKKYAENKDTEDFTMFHLIANGNKNGKEREIVSTLLYKNDWNTLTGVVAASAAQLVNENTEEKKGCFFIAEGIDVLKLMNKLREQGVFYDA